MQKYFWLLQDVIISNRSFSPGIRRLENSWQDTGILCFIPCCVSITRPLHLPPSFIIKQPSPRWHCEVVTAIPLETVSTVTHCCICHSKKPSCIKWWVDQYRVLHFSERKKRHSKRLKHPHSHPHTHIHKQKSFRHQIFIFDFLVMVRWRTGIRPKFSKVDECCRGFNSACVNNRYLCLCLNLS